MFTVNLLNSIEPPLYCAGTVVYVFDSFLQLSYTVQVYKCFIVTIVLIIGIRNGFKTLNQLA